MRGCATSTATTTPPSSPVTPPAARPRPPCWSRADTTAHRHTESTGWADTSHCRWRVTVTPLGLRPLAVTPVGTALSTWPRGGRGAIIRLAPGLAGPEGRGVWGVWHVVVGQGRAQGGRAQGGLPRAAGAGLLPGRWSRAVGPPGQRPPGRCRRRAASAYTRAADPTCAKRGRAASAYQCQTSGPQAGSGTART